MQDVNAMTRDQLVEMAVRHELIEGAERCGYGYRLRLETGEMEFEPEVATAFLRGMIRTYQQWVKSSVQRSAVALGISA